MAVDDLRPQWDTPGLFIPDGGTAQIPGGSGLYSVDGFTEDPGAPGLFLFNEIPATAATLTPYLTGNPWVEVYFPQLDPATERVTIFRFSDNRTWEVRGGVNITPGVAVQDFEVPFNTVSTYRAQMFDSTGASLGFTSPVDITVTMPEGFTVVHQPLDPSLWTRVLDLQKSAKSILRATPGSSTYAQGATVPRFTGSRREAVKGLALSWMTDTLAAADMLQAMLGTYEQEQVGVLCIRTTLPMRIPRTLFLHTDELPEEEVDVNQGGQTILFNFTGDEVEPPYPGLATPLLTYDDIDASFETYDAADAAYATYTDRDRAYELAGAAG